MIKAWLVPGLLLASASCPNRVVGQEEIPAGYVRRSSWQDTLLDSRSALKALSLPDGPKAEQTAAFQRQIEDDFPVQWDWTLQDYGRNFSDWFSRFEDTT